MSKCIRATLALLGEQRAGKSSLVSQLNHNTPINKNYDMTIEASISLMTVNIPDSNYSVELHIIDVGGSSLFKDSTEGIIQDVENIIICYDMSSRKSFDNVSEWINIYKSSSKSNFSVNGVLLGCKSDLKKYSNIAAKEAIDLGKKYNLVAMECSSLNHENLHIPFQYIAQKIFDAQTSKLN